jgi:hypothetical protein
MPVRKLRSLEEAEAPCWRDKNDPRLWRCIAALWHFSHVTAPQRWTPGIRKYGSIEEAGSRLPTDRPN